MSNIDIKLTEEELSNAISSLLFSCSVNVVSNTEDEYQQRLLSLAEKLKTYQPDIKLKNVQFIQEENYEDSVSEKVLSSFKENIEITNFDNV